MCLHLCPWKNLCTCACVQIFHFPLGRGLCCVIRPCDKGTLYNVCIVSSSSWPFVCFLSPTLKCYCRVSYEDGHQKVFFDSHLIVSKLGIQGRWLKLNHFDCCRSGEWHAFKSSYMCCCSLYCSLQSSQSAATTLLTHLLSFRVISRRYVNSSSRDLFNWGIFVITPH